MSKCWVCCGGILECACDRPANDNASFDPGFIRLPSDETLCRRSTFYRLAVTYAAMKLSRRSVLDHLTDQLVAFHGVAVTACGRRFDPADIDVDEVFRTDNDPSERWISDFLRFATEPPRRNAQSRTAPRLRVLWLALAISHRQRAEIAIK